MVVNTDLRVLMLGGRRCGKTSVLASMFQSIVNGATNQYLTVADDTRLETKGVEKQEPLSGKTAELKHLLSSQDRTNAATFLVDLKPTKYWWNYRLKVKIPGTDREMFINFADVPGEFCRQGNEHENEVKEYVKQCDVFIVTIDTPYLMESANHQNKLCSEGINDVINRVPDIQQYLTCIDNNKGQNGKMVIFCPVKCEKWYNEGRIHEVCERVKSVYDTCITNLNAYQRMDISIVPILTAGNIEFVEQKEAFLLSHNGKFGKPQKCAQLSSKFLRLEDGSMYALKDGDIVNEDPEAQIEGTNLMRPLSWFKIRYNSDSSFNGYKPLNCEQLPLHIIRFMLNKKDYMDKHPSSLWDRMKRWFGLMFGSINPNELRDIISKLQTSGILKESQDEGIIIIKHAY